MLARFEQVQPAGEPGPLEGLSQGVRSLGEVRPALEVQRYDRAGPQDPAASAAWALVRVR